MIERVWGKKSQIVRETLDPRLKLIVDEILYGYADISLLYGYRGKWLQNRLYAEGVSKLRWPESKHNSLPSLAVDIQPYPRPIEDNVLHGALGFLGGVATVIAQRHGVPLVWGGDWNQNGSMVDNKFNDLFHLEIRE
jgi:hypothetical protein